MTEPMTAQRLAAICEVHARTADLIRKEFGNDFANTAQGHRDELLAEVKRLNAHLAEFIGWEPTVKEEYEHACDQLLAVEEIVKAFAATRAPSVVATNEFVASLKHALEMP